MLKIRFLWPGRALKLGGWTPLWDLVLYRILSQCSSCYRISNGARGPLPPPRSQGRDLLSVGCGKRAPPRRARKHMLVPRTPGSSVPVTGCCDQPTFTRNLRFPWDCWAPLEPTDPGPLEPPSPWKEAPASLWILLSDSFHCVNVCIVDRTFFMMFVLVVTFRTFSRIFSATKLLGFVCFCYVWLRVIAISSLHTVEMLAVV